MSDMIKTFIDGKEVPRAKVLAWERQRAIAVLRKLGVKTASSQSLGGLHDQLLARKAEIGQDGIGNLLRRELAISERMGALASRLSLGARQICVTELLVKQGRAEHFMEWFDSVTRSEDARPLLGATPDHYRLHTSALGVMEVIETTGGSPLAMHIFLDFSDVSSLVTLQDPSFPVQLVGVARTAGGVAIGGVRHQFRNEGSGFRARLMVEFPWLMFPHMVNGHRWHLASEFGNWIEYFLSKNEKSTEKMQIVK